MDIFQEATLLNRIIMDLRSIIQEYLRTYPLFVIGKHNSSYPGYQITTKHDIKCYGTMKTFQEYYIAHQGLPAIDSFIGSLLCCDKRTIFLQNRYIRCTFEEYYDPHNSIPIKLGTIVPFRISGEPSLINIINNICIGHTFEHYDNLDYKIGLYIKCD